MTEEAGPGTLDASARREIGPGKGDEKCSSIGRGWEADPQQPGDGGGMVLVCGIPEVLHSADLRSFFTDWVEGSK